MKVKVEIILEEGGKLPTYATPGSAGMDLCSSCQVVIAPGEYQTVPTGIKIALPEGYEAQIRPRSGLAAKHGIGMVNGPGTIDCDFRGEIKVILINYGQEPFEIERGDRIAQMIISPVTLAEWKLVDKMNNTERGEGGFGSTGRH